MPIARGMMPLWLMALMLAFSFDVWADEAPQLEPAAALIVLKVPGSGYVNVRALPDPRSALVQQIAVGSANLRATGGVKLYGDTWWIEVQSGAVTGWLNARLLARVGGGTPLQPMVNIDDFSPTNGYQFTAAAFDETAVTSYDECARRCVGDGRCAALEYRSAIAVCRLFDTRPEVVKQTGVHVAVRPVKTPPGGWSAQSAARFERVQEQAYDAPGFRDTLTHSADECAVACGLDQRCAAYVYQRRQRLCTAYERLEKLSARTGVETGMRQIVVPPVDIATIPVPAPPVLPRSAKTKEPMADQASINDAFHMLFKSASQGIAYATPELQRQGRITFSLAESPLGSAMHAAVLPRALDGSLHNLAAMLGRTDGQVVHLVFHAALGASPIILASSTYPTLEAATVAALALQKDLDDLAKQAGLGVDPLSLLKPLRR